MNSETVRIAVGGSAVITGDITLPECAGGMVLFAHGSGSSRHSPRNRFVAAQLQRAGLATLLIDLLTEREDEDYERRFDIALLTERLALAANWLAQDPRTGTMARALFGSSTGAAAALQLAARSPDAVAAVVSRGGRPDLAGEEALGLVRSPVLLIIGGHDREVIELNRAAAELMDCPLRIEIIPGATHLFEEPGALERAAQLAADWLTRHLLAKE
ncbi:MAG: dienelactone hydrolase family protein [Burkholderiaceae bacterium]|nr:dienelactone hydrolase family protein [Burkholderiaceae bacterium]